MDLTIYSIGDENFLWQVLNAVARMFAGDGTFQSVAMIGFLVGVLLLGFEALMNAGQSVKFQNLLIAWIVWMLLFGWTANAKIHDVYDGSFQNVENLPGGMVATASMISGLGYALAYKFEDHFSLPNMVGPGTVTGGSAASTGFGRALELLHGLRTIPKNAPDSLTGNEQIDRSIKEYIKNCVQTSMNIDANDGPKSLDEIVKAQDTWEAMFFDSDVWVTTTYLEGDEEGGQTRTCENAHEKIGQTLTSGDFRGQLTENMNAEFATEQFTMDIKQSMRFMAGDMIDARLFMQNRFLGCLLRNQKTAADIRRAMASSRLSSLSCVSGEQAVASANIEMAGRSAIFANYVRPLLGFLEGLIWAISPFMALVIGLGMMGVKLVGKYLMLLLWISTWLPILAITNLYINMAAQGKLGDTGWADPTSGVEVLSVAYQTSVAKTAASYLSIGADMAAATPLLGLFLISGSIYTFNSLAQRMNPASGADPGGASTPRLGEQKDAIATVENTKGSITHSAMQGTSTPGSEQVMPKLQAGSALSSMQKSAQSQMQGAREDLTKSLGTSYASTVSSQEGWKGTEQLGRSIRTSEGQTAQTVDTVMNKIADTQSLSTSEKDQLRGMVAGGLSAGGFGQAQIQNMAENASSAEMKQAIENFDSQEMADKYSAEFQESLQKDVSGEKTDQLIEGVQSQDQESLENKASSYEQAQETYETSKSLESQFGSGWEVGLQQAAYNLDDEASSNLNQAVQELGLNDEANSMAQGFQALDPNMSDEKAEKMGNLWALSQAAQGQGDVNDAQQSAAANAFAGVLGHYGMATGGMGQPEQMDTGLDPTSDAFDPSRLSGNDAAGKAQAGDDGAARATDAAQDARDKGQQAAEASDSDILQRFAEGKVAVQDQDAQQRLETYDKMQGQLDAQADKLLNADTTTRQTTENLSGLYSWLDSSTGGPQSMSDAEIKDQFREKAMERFNSMGLEGEKYQNLADTFAEKGLAAVRGGETEMQNTGQGLDGRNEKLMNQAIMSYRDQASMDQKLDLVAARASNQQAAQSVYDNLAQIQHNVDTGQGTYTATSDQLPKMDNLDLKTPPTPTQNEPGTPAGNTQGGGRASAKAAFTNAEAQNQQAQAVRAEARYQPAGNTPQMTR